MARSAPTWPFSAVVTSTPARCSTRPDEFPVGVAVLDQQNADAGQRRQGSCWPVAACCGCRPPAGRPGCDALQRSRGDGRGKRAPLAHLAGDGDAAAEGLGNAAADRQSQAGAAELPRHGIVGLDERIEDRRRTSPAGCRRPCRSPRSQAADPAHPGRVPPGSALRPRG